MKTHILTSTILGGAIFASAHLDPITAPKAGAVVRPGQALQIMWGVGQPHGTQDLAYSQDGSTWTTITPSAGLGRNTESYSWTVPANMKASTTTRLRVCQRDAGTCSNDPAFNVPHLSRDTLGAYTAITGNFTIEATTGISGFPLPFAEARIQMNSESHFINLTFEIFRTERITLHAIDIQGKLLSVLLDVEKSEGRHALSVSSSALDVSKPIFLRLQAGEKVLQKAIQTTP